MNKWMIAAVAASLFAWDKARADIIIVNNLASNSSQISGIKNAVDATYYQGFEPTISGTLNSFVMDLGLQQINNQPPPINGSGYATMSVFLYSANSSGAPMTELATLATAITVSGVENAGIELPGGVTGPNDSFIYQYTVNLSGIASGLSLTADEKYDIEISLSSGSQQIGWAEENGSDTEPGGEIGKLTPTGSGYGRMELDMTAVPEASTMLSGLSCLGLL